MEDKDEKYSIELIKKINALSKRLGFTQDEQTLFEIKKTDDANVKELHLKKGSWDSEDPWFAIDMDDDKKAYAFIPADAFSQMIDALRISQQENFNLKLEKTIWQNVPIDFEDVWVVAMEEIKNHARGQNPKKPVSIDLDKLITKIKAEHPNLFINLKDFIPPQLTNNNNK